MSDRAKIMAGLIVVLVLVTFPLWYGWGRKAAPPELRLDTPAITELKDRRCVEATPYMKAHHMRLLKAWRDGVVREGRRTYTASDGKMFEMNLTGTCLKCHSNKDQFCDRCHDYLGVKPNCWMCHIDPTAQVRGGQ